MEEEYYDKRLLNLYAQKSKSLALTTKDLLFV